MAKKSLVRQRIEKEIRTNVKLKFMDFERARDLAWKKFSTAFPDSDDDSFSRSLVRREYECFLTEEELESCGIKMAKKRFIEKEIEEINIIYNKRISDVEWKMKQIGFHLDQIEELANILKEKQEELNILEN